jgi:hypothetical protein
MRTLTAARSVLVALLLALFVPVASAAGQETFYLGPDGFPLGSLVTSPRGGEMPNFDLGRDTQPGLLLERSGSGLAEVEETKFQHWQAEMGGERVSGYPAVVIWSAPAGFAAGLRSVISVFILDCGQLVDPCTELGASEVVVESGRGGDWVESRIDFAEIDHHFGEGRYLGVRVVVSDSSDSDLMLAYGYPKQRSRLTISAEPPAVSAETAALFVTESQAESVMSIERARGLTPVVSTAAIEAEGGGDGSVWLWVVPIILSSLVLMALGTFLVSGLTKPGRHERRIVMRRISMSR